MFLMIGMYIHSIDADIITNRSITALHLLAYNVIYVNLSLYCEGKSAVMKLLSFEMACYIHMIIDIVKQI